MRYKFPNDFENRTSKPTNSTPLSQNRGPAPSETQRVHFPPSVQHTSNMCLVPAEWTQKVSGSFQDARVQRRWTMTNKLIIGCGTSSEMGFERWHFHQLQCLQRILELKRVSDGRCKRNGCETPISGRRKPSDSKGSSSKTLYIKYRWVGLGIFQGCY